MSDHQTSPYRMLGKHLRQLREQRQESLLEVAAAVEIDESKLAKMEDGRERPSQDILVLLINHFDMPDPAADRVWELAGYPLGIDLPNLEETISAGAKLPAGVPPNFMIMGPELSALYSDAVEIVGTPAGLTMQFGQQSFKGPVKPVAKIGMSYEQVAQLNEALQRTLMHAKYLRGPRQLPPGQTGAPGNFK